MEQEIVRNINRQLEDLNFDLIEHKMKVFKDTQRALLRSAKRLPMLEKIRAPRSIIDGEVRLFVRLSSRFFRLKRWAEAPATDDFINTMLTAV